MLSKLFHLNSTSLFHKQIKQSVCSIYCSDGEEGLFVYLTGLVRIPSWVLLSRLLYILHTITSRSVCLSNDYNSRTSLVALLFSTSWLRLIITTRIKSGTRMYGTYEFLTKQVTLTHFRLGPFRSLRQMSRSVSPGRFTHNHMSLAAEELSRKPYKSPMVTDCIGFLKLTIFGTYGLYIYVF